MNGERQRVRRFKATLSGTNLELTGDYNQRLVYQAVRINGPTTRNALIELTGLAKPTIAGIVKRLLRSDLVSETGRIYGGRGQPAVHLEANAEGCFSVGLHVDEDRLSLVTIDALGKPLSRAATSLPSPSRSLINSFFRQKFVDLTRDIRREKIIGLGVAVAESVVSARHTASDPEGDGVGIDLLALSEIAAGVPVYVDSDLSAATAGESLFGRGAELQSYYYVLLDGTVVGGLVIQQALYKGAHPSRRRLLFPDSGRDWCSRAVTVERDARRTGRSAPPANESWLNAAADDLVPVLISINCMLNPGAVLLGGSFPQEWMKRLADRCNHLLLERAPQIPSHANVQAARLGGDATLVGAASLPMRARLFPIEEALLKAPEHAA